MSRTLSEAISVVRYHLRDRNAQSAAFSDPEYQLELQSQVRKLATQLILGEVYQVSAFTTVSGLGTYPVNFAAGNNSSVEVAGYYELRSQTYGLMVPIVSKQVFEQYRQGSGTNIPQAGIPYVAATHEDDSQVLQLDLWPIPSQVIVFDVYRAIMPYPFYSPGTMSLLTPPAFTIIPFDDEGFEALCWFTADSLFKRMTDEAKARNELAKDANRDWTLLATSLVAGSRRRMRNIKRSMYRIRGRKW